MERQMQERAEENEYQSKYRDRGMRYNGMFIE